MEGRGAELGHRTRYACATMTAAGPRAVVLLFLVTILAGCGGVAIPPAYTQDELKAECDRRRGWWRPDDLRGGYCDFRGP